MDDDFIQIIRSQVRGVGSNLSAVIEENKSINRENVALRHRICELETHIRERKRVHRGTQSDWTEREGPVYAHAVNSSADSMEPRHKTSSPPHMLERTGRHTRLPTFATRLPGLAAVTVLGERSRTQTCDSGHLSFICFTSLLLHALAPTPNVPNHIFNLPRIIRRTPFSVSDFGLGLGFFLMVSFNADN